MAVDELQKDPMMAHLLEALEKGEDIGHYGRLVFVMVGRHLLDDDALVEQLRKDKDCGEEEARALVAQVQAHDYSPPKRQRILEWQQEQDFPIIPDPDDPEAGNVYRTLQFPDDVYEHISEYYEQRAS
jgi:hypothetical protein